MNHRGSLHDRREVAIALPVCEQDIGSTSVTSFMFAAPSALHVTNLTSLVWLRKECADDPQRAAQLFCLEQSDARFYGELADFAIEALCSELDLSLLVPRFDCRTLPSVLAECRQQRRERPPSELELHNLRNLQALRETCLRSHGDAVWTYRIDHETADAYRCLEHASVVALCQALTGSAFVPRYEADLVARILDKPPGARAVFAAAYETDVAAASEAARRSIYLTH